MSKVLIIDDSDPAIIYNGLWTTAMPVTASTNEYNSTLHRSENSGDTLSYTFYGTEIKVYGTLDSPATNGSPNATFSLDGSTPAGFNNTGAVLVDDRTTVTSHIPFYQTTGLIRGWHTLSITTGAPINPAARLYIDFFTVTTGSDSASGNIIVDERDFSFTYSGSWAGWGTPNEYLGTTLLCPGVGSSAVFRFNGTSATIFGTTRDTLGPDTAAIIGFSIDGTQRGNFTGPQNATPIKNTPFFHVEGLSDDHEHIIVATSLAPNDWYMDYAVYTAQNPSNSNGSSQTLSPQGIIDGGDSGRNTTLGVVAGIVVAGVVSILAIAGIIFMLLRRRKARHSIGEKSGAPNAKGPLVPFNLPSLEADSCGAPNEYRTPAGTIPPCKDIRTSRTALLRAPASSVYSEPESSIQGGGTQMAEIHSFMPLSSAVQHPDHLPQSLDPIHGHAVYSRNTRLYPQANTTSSPGGSSSTRLILRDSQVQVPKRPIGLKARFMRTTPTITPPIHRPLPSVALTVEEDSGIRLPVTSPPRYTLD